jgi:hypothetical protein
MKQRSDFVNQSNGDHRPDIWRIFNGTLEVRASVFRIISYNRDTVMLSSVTSADTIMLFKNCATIWSK